MLGDDRGLATRAALIFTVLVMAQACVYWGLIVIAQHGLLPFTMGAFDFSLADNSIPGLALVFAMRLFGPALAAFLTLAWVYGRPGLRSWGSSILRWRFPGWLYLLVFLGPLAISAIIVAIGYPLGLLRFDPSQVHVVKFIVLFLLLIFFDGPLGEELGWRGLLLPALFQRMSPLNAGLLVGVIWFIWHMPLYLADGKALHPVGYFINVVSLSVIVTWFYIKSGQSTFMAVLLHATTNYALFLIIKSFTLPEGIASLQWIYDALLVVAASAAAWALWRQGSVAALRAA